MSKCLKKLFAIVIALAILIACIPTVSVFATTLGGTCGENVNWSLDTESGVLTISGSGDMYDYYYSSNAPWYSQRSSIKSVSIENGVTSIGWGAFYGCSSLTSVTIPDSVTSIGWGAFYGCSSLTAINVGGGNQSYSSQDGVLFNKNKTELICCPGGKSGEYVIPDSVTSIGYSAFYDCSSLTSITIPDSVTSIGWYAFENCNSLTTITIPDSVTSIGDSAFEYCSSLTSVTIPDSVTSIGWGAFNDTAYYNNEDNWTNDVLFIDNHLIKAKENLSGEYIIPTDIKTISGGAFEDCSSLTSVDIPNSVTSIGDSAFEYCSSLTAINVGGGNQSYSSQDGVLFNKNKTKLILCPGGKSGEYVIPDSVISIGDSAFEGCNSLTSITIPDSVTSIGEYAFFDCSSLTSVTIPDSVTSIGHFAFYGCSSLTTITIPDSVTSIRDYAFYGCDNLTIICYKNSAAHNYAIENYIPYTLINGDANGDGRINNKDLALLMQKLNGWAVEIDDAVADVTADGKVNNKDYALLMRYINGWNVEIG